MRAQRPGGAPAVRAATVAENSADGRVRARGDLGRVGPPGLDLSITEPGPPVVRWATPWRSGGRGPLLGEHNDAVYGELGLSDGELSQLKSAGAI